MFKEEKPFFSVVVPIYNKSPHIHRAVRSVLNQTFSDFELLLIDDASTDNSLEEIQKYTDKRIRIFRRETPGKGGYAARNLGIKESRSKWIAFLDADDEWYPEHLYSLKNLSINFPAAKVLSCGYEILNPGLGVDNMGERSVDPYYNKHYKKGDHYLSFDEYLQSINIGITPIWTSATSIHKVILEQVGGFPEGKAERGGDVDTWLRCIEHAGGMAWGGNIGAVYYRDAINMVTRTAWSDASIQRLTVRKLLPKYTHNTKKLLKKFANRRTTGAWCLNAHLVNTENFSLMGKLYLTVNPIRNLLWILLSLFPNKVAFKIMKIKK